MTFSELCFEYAIELHRAIVIRLVFKKNLDLISYSTIISIIKIDV